MGDRVLDATVDQLCVVGPDALTMEAIASRARVSVGLLYRRHTSLEELVRAALDEHLPSAAAAIPSRSPLTAVGQHRSGVPDRLLVDALLSLRRFPALHRTVAPVITSCVGRVGHMRACVVIGLQALGIVGVAPDAADTRALLDLEQRMRSREVADAMTPRSIPTVPADAGVPHARPHRDDGVAASLRAATATSLTQAAGGGTVREIASMAGVTTGAVYRRYDTKDDLVADTIRERIDRERTGWAGEFFASLADSGNGDPASVLAAALAFASAPDSALTHEAIALTAAARVGPAAREALAERYTTAVTARKEQFAFLASHGFFRHDDSPAALAWSIQVCPAGARLVGLTTPLPDADGWLPDMRLLLTAL